jgi:hypothetical protein
MIASTFLALSRLTFSLLETLTSWFLTTKTLSSFQQASFWKLPTLAEPLPPIQL